MTNVWLVGDAQSDVREVFATEELAQEFFDIHNNQTIDYEGWLDNSLMIGVYEIRETIDIVYTTSANVRNFKREQSEIFQSADSEIGGWIQISVPMDGFGSFFVAAFSEEAVQQKLIEIDSYLEKIQRLCEKHDTALTYRVDLTTGHVTKQVRIMQPSWVTEYVDFSKE